MTTYNGHRNYNCWNVALWFFNDEGFYQLIKDTMRRYARQGRDTVAQRLLDELHAMDIYQTPDGVRYTKTNIRAALVGWED